MKKIFYTGIAFVLMFGLLSYPVKAETIPAYNVITYTEYCDDGSYYVIEVGTSVRVARDSSTEGYKSSTYYSGNGVAIWSVTVNGTFSYVAGVSSKAKTASCIVKFYSADAEFVSKNAYVSGASAVAQATVKYGKDNTSRSVTLTCDTYGKLS